MSKSVQRNSGTSASGWQQLFQSSLPLERETSLFVLVSTLDLFMTYLLLRYSSAGATFNVIDESNPVARYFLSEWNVRGLVFFKFALVAFVAVIAQVIAQKKLATARRLLNFATILIAVVVVYSLTLLIRNTNIL